MSPGDDIELHSRSLSGQVALVTGAARRIGAAIAEALHAQGVDVAIHCRGSLEEAEVLCAKLNSTRDDSSIVLQADLADTDRLPDLISEVIRWKDRLDVLVNNASAFYPTALAEVSESAWEDLMSSNLKAPLFLASAAADALKRSAGNIVNIVDIHARRPLKDHHIYGAAKSGLAMLTRSLARDLAPEVRVNGVAPGAIAWPEDGMTEDIKASILKQIPLGRTGEPRDIANAVIFLIRDATYVTGQIIPIDGGRSIGW